MNAPNPFDSPACTLLDHTADAIVTIAPERRNDVQRLFGAVRFVVTERGGTAFSASAVASEVQVSLRGLEFLWVLSYTSWVMHRHYAARKQSRGVLRFSDHADTAALPTLLGWAHENQLANRAYTAWPDKTPRPSGPLTVTSSQPSDERVASELALCAVAWILHHELAHIVAGDGGAVAPDVQILREKQADQVATCWILDDAPPGPATVKRGLGIAMATVALAGWELLEPPMPGVPRDHPHPADRLWGVLSHPALKGDSVVHLVAALTLKLELDHAGTVVVRDDFASADDALSEYCVALKKALP